MPDAPPGGAHRRRGRHQGCAAYGGGEGFVVLQEGHAPEPALVAACRHVRSQLAAHEYPREIAFVDALPTTATGKIMRKALKESAGQSS
jgi:acetyl-CoA synthetase